MRIQAERDGDTVKAGGVYIALIAIVLSCMVLRLLGGWNHRPEP